MIKLKNPALYLYLSFLGSFLFPITYGSVSGLWPYEILIGKAPAFVYPAFALGLFSMVMFTFDLLTAQAEATLNFLIAFSALAVVVPSMSLFLYFEMTGTTGTKPIFGLGFFLWNLSLLLVFFIEIKKTTSNSKKNL